MSSTYISYGNNRYMVGDVRYSTKKYMKEKSSETYRIVYRLMTLDFSLPNAITVTALNEVEAIEKALQKLADRYPEIHPSRIKISGVKPFISNGTWFAC